MLGPVPLIRTIFLAKDQKRNDYLVFGTDPELDTMPTTKDREQIYKMFEDVFDQWREKVKDLECEPIVKSWRAPVIEAPVAQPKPIGTDANDARCSGLNSNKSGKS